MTIQYYPNAISLTFTVANPANTQIAPRLLATLRNDVSSISFNVQTLDPIADVVEWLADRSITVTAVLHNGNVWWLATTFEGELEI